MQANTKRKRDDDDSGPLGLPPGRSAAAVTDIHKRLDRTAKSAHNLTDEDLMELYKILQGAIAAHSAHHRPSAEMLDSFVSKVFGELNARPHLRVLPGPPLKMPYREGDLDEDRDVYALEHLELSPEDQVALDSEYPNSKPGYYAVRLSFDQKVEVPFQLEVRPKRSGGGWKVERIWDWEFEMSHDAKHELAQVILEFFGRECDKHNEKRAIQYAQVYIQEKGLSVLGEGSTRDYAFEQLSDIYEGMLELETLCWGASCADPKLFGQRAEPI